MDSELEKARTAMIEELMITLKIPQGSFNFGTIKDEISHISNENLRDFYRAVVSADSFGNGMKAIIDTAQLFKPKEIVGGVDLIEVKAKKLITLVHTMSDKVFEDAQKLGTQFDTLLKIVKFPNISDNTIAILDNVAPHYNHKTLVGNIRTYQTSKDALDAFKKALTPKEQNENMIAHNGVKKLLQQTA